MKQSLALSLAMSLALTLGQVVHASDGAKLDDARVAEIKATLTEQGYDVRRVKAEDGMYEAYVMKDGERLEVYLNDKLEIVKTKTDD
ncbi:hypothetical protein ACSSV4_003725 [Roseovarius sp. MBR-154]|jgi:hypothetical protein